MDHLVLTEDLAIRLIRVSLLADGGLDKVLVENVESVHVARSKLWAVDFCSSENSCSLIGSGNISRANVRDAVTRLNAFVDPAFLLYNGQEVLNTLSSAGSLGSYLLKVETLSA